MRDLIDHDGRRVKLTSERERHILEHPEMTALLPEIERTLREPQIVRRSRSEAAAELCYRFYSKTVVGDKWLCVVVKYQATDAFVLTAYLTDRVKSGETLWPKP